MHFSTKIRYGLRFLLRLALQKSVVKLSDVAAEEGISQGYLEQIVRVLQPLKIFRSARGVGGGYVLAQSPEAISLESIFLQLDGGLSVVSCLDNPEECKRSHICSTRPFWMDFEQHIRCYLRGKSLQSLIETDRRFQEEHMWDYTQAVHDHFLHPHNAGPLQDANAVGEVGSLACGDALRLYLKISDAGIIEKAGFETFGCASAIASSSVLTDMVIGMPVDEALKLTNKDIVDHRGGLPREKMHCSVMGQEALEAAIRNWRGEPPVPHAQEIGRLVCKCFGVTDAQIRRTIRENSLTTVDEVTDYTKAGGACGECRDTIAEILAAELGRKHDEAAKPSAKPALTNVQRMQAVFKVLAGDIQPILQAGESVDLVDVNGLRVVLAVQSAKQDELRSKAQALFREKIEDGIVVEVK